MAKTHIFNTAVGLGHSNDTPIRLTMSVPQIWPPHSNVALIEAAKNLGVLNCTLVGEALCVAAYMLEKEVNRLGPTYFEVSAPTCLSESC